MIEKYEQKVVLGYVGNVIEAAGPASAVGRAVVKWLVEGRGQSVGLRARDFDVPDETDDFDLFDERPPMFARGATLDKARWQDLRKLVRTKVTGMQNLRPGRTERRLRGLATLLGLNDLEREVLGVMARYAVTEGVEHLWDYLNVALGGGRRLQANERVLALLLHASRNAIAETLSTDSTLVASGFITIDEDGDVSVLDRLRRILTTPLAPGRDLRQVLLGKPVRGHLDWSDFDHIGDARDQVAAILAGALKHQHRGVNVLLYGPPGTGKTEFCKTLAHRLNVPLFAIGEADEAGNEPERRERLGELRMAQRLMASGGLLLFDEAEDLLDRISQGLPFGPRGRLGSKVFLNRCLENTPVPVLWTANDVDGIDAAILRRMSFAIELRVPPAPIRERVWSRVLSKHGVALPEIEIAKLAREFPAAPALADSAVVAAKLAGGDAEVVRGAVRGIGALVGGTSVPMKPSSLPFDPALINAGEESELLSDLLQRLSARDAPRAFSICLSGPPGTGKSAWVRHLAEAMGLEVLEKRASDLLSMYVGDTEKSIARAFAEARAAGAFLVFDEADSLLGDRRGAVRSWEVSQVNEMLTWMEAHPLPFACTTNLSERLDEASWRRFLIKVRFHYLLPDQADRAFRQFFELEPPTKLKELSVLTPADFAVVRRKAELLGGLDNADLLLRMLRAECGNKPNQTRPVGFKSTD